MNYRNIVNLNDDIKNNLYRIPKDVDLIVGIPRSGMLAANIIALHLNLPFTDVDGYINNRIMSSGLSRKAIGKKITAIDESKKALIIDDSILRGGEMKRVRDVIEAAGLTEKSLFSAIYCHPEREHDIDLSFEVCPTPRVFEWNLMHHDSIIPQACVDIDGVLCEDPTDEQNDDGPKYREFLRSAQPLLIPTAKVGMLVTSRLEKYRSLTEEWLASHGVQYSELVMMQYASMAERRQANAYASYKGNVYKDSDMILFIESSDDISADIAKESGKYVLCTESQNVYAPTGIGYAKHLAKIQTDKAEALGYRIARKIKRIIFGLTGRNNTVK